MATTYNTQIVTDGLQFYYDAKNTDKSWKGEPTTNFLKSPLNILDRLYWNTTALPVTVTQNATTAPNYTQTADLVLATNTLNTLFYQVLQNSVIGTGVQTCTVYAKAYTAANFTLNAYYSGDTEVNIAFYLGSGTCDPGGVIIPVGNGWYRCQITVPAKVGAGTDFYYRIWPGGRSLTNTLGCYFWGHQVESKSYATPFVVGSRSNTQAVIDLTDNNTITATSLTYSSNNDFTFNGTTNYMDCGNGTAVQQYNAVTLAAWAYPTAFTTSGNILSKNGNTGYRLRFDGGAIPQILVDGANNVLNGPSAVTANSWYYLVGTGSSTGSKLYLNGALIASNSIAFAPSAPAGGTLIVGAFNAVAGSEPFIGKIDTAALYSRELTATEVLQNFNAHRRRYGL